MRAQIPDVTALAAAARAGDIAARDALVTACLPLVYNVVGRALDGHADVDDVVQETLLRVVDRLADLRDPARFRSWLVAIAMNQVRDRAAAREPALPGLDAAREVPDPHADFVGVTILRLGLSGQRREVAEATRWLDEDDRSLLALWWLEAAGDLTRAELAESLGLNAQHAAVRVQRMKAQLETARGVVRALAADPRCAELEAVVTAWDGKPSGLWRKRIARHVRDCDTCAAYGKGLVPAERLLAGVPLVVPVMGQEGGSGAAGAAGANAGEVADSFPSDAAVDAESNGDVAAEVTSDPPADAGVDPSADPAAQSTASGGPADGSASSAAPSGGPLHSPLALGGTLGVVVLFVLAVVLLRPDGSSPDSAPPPAPVTAGLVVAPAPTPPPATEPSTPVAAPPAAPSSATPSPTRSTPSLEQQVLALVNAERAKAGCGPVRLDPKLHSAAQKHAQDMAARRYFDHQAPDGTGPGERITAAGYRWSAWAENLNQGPTSATSAVTNWMDSSVHRSNMLDCDLTQMGVGTATGPRGMLWTQVFAAPM